MKIDSDDPRLTAYALGDLPESERAAIEMELQESPECREAVEEIRQTAKALSDQLAAEPCPALLPEQQDSIRNILEPANVVHLPRRKVFATVGLAALAACIAGVLAWQFWLGSSERGGEMAVAKRSEFHFRGNQTPPGGTVAPAPQKQEPMIAPPAIESVFDQSTSPQPKQTRDANAEIAAVSQALSERLPASDLLKNSQEVSADRYARKLDSKARAETRSNGQALAKWVQDDANAVKSPSDANAPRASAVDYAAAPNATDQLTEEPKRMRPGTVTRPGGVAPRFKMEPEGLGRPTAQVTKDVPLLGDVPYQGRLFRGENESQDTAKYPQLAENTFVAVRNSPLSTFSIDVDTASYANVRRFLNEGRMPPRDAVRIEEMINYFSYHYPQPRGEDPFAASIEVAGCPWNTEHRLVRIGLKGREIARDKRPPSNFVFLIDVSGSMQPRARLPLIQQALRQLVKKMTENDRVAIVVYASEAGVRLESTPCSEKDRILEAIDELTAGGGTNGGDGIQQAYRVAEENFIRGGVNRVILCTDGDFNVGITDQNQLVRMIQQKAKNGVFLTTLGVGTDNYKDALMQKLADKGNGNYHYLDTLEEAQKVLIDQMNGTLMTIAKDVKIQIEFNPARVNAYRLIGYEKRLLRKEDFNNDAKDAGEIGAGHTVTALYEIVPAGMEVQSAVDDLKYQHVAAEKPDRYVDRDSQEMLTLKLRYKQPDSDRSRLVEFAVTDNGKSVAKASADFKFAAAVASFGMLLRDSEYKGEMSYGAALELAGESRGADENGYRAEFLNLVRKARELQR